MAGGKCSLVMARRVSSAHSTSFSTFRLFISWNPKLYDKLWATLLRGPVVSGSRDQDWICHGLRGSSIGTWAVHSRVPVHVRLHLDIGRQLISLAVMQGESFGRASWGLGQTYPMLSPPSSAYITHTGRTFDVLSIGWRSCHKPCTDIDASFQFPGLSDLTQRQIASRVLQNSRLFTEPSSLHWNAELRPFHNHF